MNIRRTSVSQSKKPTIILTALGIWLTFIIGIIWPWIYKINKLDPQIPILAYISAGIWWLIFFWTLYHLTFQVASLFVESPKKEQAYSHLPSIAIIYPTRDDFNSFSCKTCLDQNYKNFRVIICDDSVETRYKTMVREFCKNYSAVCQLITRADNKGFKAGNLNNTIENHVTEDWVLLVDADQFLPTDYLSELVSILPTELEQIAFVQGAHETIVDYDSSDFQIALSPGTSLYYFHDLTLRQAYGFVPMLGHGALIPKKVWEVIGKFPEIVSEDFAFTLRAATHGQRGLYIERVRSYEAFPYDFGGFLLRLKKYAGATAELFRQEVIPFLIKSESNIEKWDFLMQLTGYAIMPFAVINGYLGAFVSYELWNSGVSYLHPILPYIYIWLFLTFFALKISATDGWAGAFRFYFWSTAIYTASMPLAGWHFLKHLFVRPTFNRTPKNSEETTLDPRESCAMIVLGITALTFAIKWISPFSPVLVGQGIAYLSFPIYSQLNSNSNLGHIARLVVVLPGFFMLFAIYTMWNWGRF